jgi:plasmid maintenance system antidote protein VapI
MPLILEKPERRSKKTNRVKKLLHTPNYLYLMPPGEVLEEKMFEMGIDAAELAKQMKVSVKTVEQLLKAKIPLTQTLADKIENITRIPAQFMLRAEKSYREKCIFAMEHPEIPAYRGTEIINQPEKKFDKINKICRINK